MLFEAFCERKKMKNIKLKPLLSLIMISAVFFMYSGAKLLAQPHDMGPKNMGPKDGKWIAEKLNFDDEQKQELKKLSQEHKVKMKSLGEEIHKLHDELFGLLKESPIDQTKADSLISLIADNRKKMDTEVFNHLSDIKSLCKTDEQRKLFAEFVDEMGKMHGPPPMQPPPPPEDK
jgi:Spy/CpxP family protein refolding chaperone